MSSAKLLKKGTHIERIHMTHYSVKAPKGSLGSPFTILNAYFI